MLYQLRYLQRLLLAATLVVTFCTGVQAQGTGWSDPQPLNSYAFRDSSRLNELDPQIENDGGDNWISMWVSPNRRQLLFARSQDAGATWGPTYADLRATTGSGTQAYEQVYSTSHVYAGENRWVAAWTVTTPNASASGFKAFAAVSTDFGKTWSEPVLLLPDVGPIKLAADGTGNVLCTVTRTNVQLLRSSDFGQTWTAPQDLSMGEPQAVIRNSQIDYAGSGNWLLVSSSVSITGVGAARRYLNTYSVSSSFDLGENWTTSAPVHLDYASAVSTSFDVHVHGNTVVVAAFSPYYKYNPDEYDNLGYMVFVSNDKGTTFTGPVWVERPIYETQTPDISLAADAAGTWVLTVTQPHRKLPVHTYTSTDPAGAWTKTASLTDGTVAQLDSAGGKAGEFVNVVLRADPTAPVPDTDFDIASIRSDSSGTTWSGYMLVNGSANEDGIQVEDNQMDLEVGENVMLAAWLAIDNYPGGSAGTMVSRSHHRGWDWDNATEVSKISNPRPDLVHVSGSSWILLWHSVDTAPGKISYSYDNGQTWTPPAAIDAYLMASNGAGTLVRARHGTLLSRSLDGGHTWEADTTIGGSQFNFVLHAGGSSWVAVRAPSGFFISIDNGVTWTLHDGPPFFIQGIAADRSGGIVAAGSTYVAGDPYKYDRTLSTYISRSTDGGVTWLPQTLVHKQTRTEVAHRSDFVASPQPVWLGGNRWALFPKNILWVQGSQFDTISIRYMDIFYAESSDGAATWSTPEPLLSFVGGTFSTSTDYAVIADTLTVAYITNNKTVNGQSTGYDKEVFTINKRLRSTSAAQDWALFE